MWRKCGGIEGISICSLLVLIVDGIWWMVDGRSWKFNQPVFV